MRYKQVTSIQKWLLTVQVGGNFWRKTEWYSSRDANTPVISAAKDLSRNSTSIYLILSCHFVTWNQKLQCSDETSRLGFYWIQGVPKKFEFNWSGETSQCRSLLFWTFYLLKMFGFNVPIELIFGGMQLAQVRFNWLRLGATGPG